MCVTGWTVTCTDRNLWGCGVAVFEDGGLDPHPDKRYALYSDATTQDDFDPIIAQPFRGEWPHRRGGGGGGGGGSGGGGTEADNSIHSISVRIDWIERSIAFAANDKPFCVVYRYVDDLEHMRAFVLVGYGVVTLRSAPLS